MPLLIQQYQDHVLRYLAICTFLHLSPYDSISHTTLLSHNVFQRDLHANLMPRS